jgi:hypothetical protein
MVALGALLALLIIVPSAAADISATPIPTWQTNGRVNAILQVGSVTYVGGNFTQISNPAGTSTQTVSDLAAFDSSGNPTSWQPTANGTVKAIASNGTTIFVGGSFTQIDGSGHHHIAAIDSAGNPLAKAAWTGTADGDVQALAVQGSTLYLGGQFATVDGVSQPWLAGLDTGNGNLVSAWRPTVDGRVDVLAANAGRVVVGGFFTTVDGTTRHGLAALDPGNAALRGGSILPSPSNRVTSMAQAADGSIYAGTFNNRLVGFDASGSFSWQRQMDGNVQAVTVSDGEVVAGGHFNNLCDLGTNCANPTVRRHLAALDPGSGSLVTTWAPSVNSDLGVFALADTTTGLAVGGDFTKIGGVAQAHLAFMPTGSSVPVDTTPPTITALPSAVMQKGTTISAGTVPLLVRYAATDASGICTYRLQRSHGSGTFTGLRLGTPAATSKQVALTPSAKAYHFRVSATDCVGNASAFQTGPAVRLAAFQDASPHIAYSAGWTRKAAPRAYGGSLHQTTRRGASARLAFTGRQVAWVATRASGRGVAKVYLDGRLAASVNLFSPSPVRRRIVFAHRWATDGPHTLRIVCAGTKGHPSVDIDALLTVR